MNKTMDINQPMKPNKLYCKIFLHMKKMYSFYLSRHQKKRENAKTDTKTKSLLT